MKLGAFSDANCKKTYTFTPYLPNGTEANGVKLTIRSMKSKESMEALVKLAGDSCLVDQKDGYTFKGANEVIKASIAQATALVVKFEGITKEDDSGPLESTPENIKMLMTNYCWLRDQVLGQALNPNNFYDA